MGKFALFYGLENEFMFLVNELMEHPGLEKSKALLVNDHQNENVLSIFAKQNVNNLKQALLGKMQQKGININSLVKVNNKYCNNKEEKE